MSYRCLVCAYDQMPHPPSGYNICPCCGVEYGLDDAFDSHEQLRDEWLAAGAPWFSQVVPYDRPANWDAWEQLEYAGLPYTVARPQGQFQTSISTVPIPDGFRLVELIRRQPEFEMA